MGVSVVGSNAPLQNSRAFLAPLSLSRWLSSSFSYLFQVEERDKQPNRVACRKVRWPKLHISPAILQPASNTLPRQPVKHQSIPTYTAPVPSLL